MSKKILIDKGLLDGLVDYTNFYVKLLKTIREKGLENEFVEEGDSFNFFLDEGSALAQDAEKLLSGEIAEPTFQQIANPQPVKTTKHIQAWQACNYDGSSAGYQKGTLEGDRWLEQTTIEYPDEEIKIVNRW